MIVVTSPALAAGLTAALGFAVATGVNAYSHDHHANEAKAHAFLGSLTPEERKELHQTAILLKKTDMELAGDICFSSNPEKVNAPKP